MSQRILVVEDQPGSGRVLSDMLAASHLNGGCWSRLSH